MTLDPEARAYLEATAALGLPPLAEQGAGEARRAARERAGELGGELETVDRIENRVVPGPAGPIPIRIYSPITSSPSPLPVLAYFHGGGWVICDLDTHESTCRALANRAGCKVVAVDYRLAPEHRYPAAVDDCWAVVEWIAESGSQIGADPGRIAVGGDSAGGNLAAAVTLRAREQGGSRLRAQLLVYPVLDFNFETASYLANATGYGLTRDSMRWYWEQYLGEGDGLGQEASPLRAGDLAGLPPALVITCEYDPLLDEGVAYAHRLAAAGVRVELVSEAGMIHGYIRMAGVIGRARKSWDESGRFLSAEFA